MNAEDRLTLLNELDEELLKGGVILSEWCVFIVREGDTTFLAGSHLAVILTALAGCETYLRSEYSNSKRERLIELINAAPIDNVLKHDLHTLRRYRNKWVHVDDPWNDSFLLEKPEKAEQELEQMDIFAVRTLRKIIYENQWI